MLWCVTGGLGFIGSRLVHKLRFEGETVRILDRANNSGDIGLHYGNHWEQLKKADVVVHLAAISGIADCKANPMDAFMTNVVGSHNVLDHAREGARVVMASSGAVVAGREPPVHVGTDPSPQNVYGHQKAAMEGLCVDKDNVVCLRFSNVYGPGGLHKPSAVHAFVRSALKNDELVVHGDGKQSRDFIFVEDVVSAIMEAARADISGVQHVGTEKLTRIGDLARLVIASAGGGHVAKDPRCDPGVDRAALSLEGNAKSFAWKPEVGIEEGVERTVEWFREVW